MSAIRMECDNSITVLIDPLSNEGKQGITKGVFLTRNYKNPSGVLPKENIFISNNEKWFYWLGYYKDFQKEIPDTIENNDLIDKIIDYINIFSSGNQLDMAMTEHCKNCNKHETLYCEAYCQYGMI